MNPATINLDRPEHPIAEYLRLERFPNIWCPGCGIGIAMHCFIRALEKSGINRDNVAMVCGIGCSSRVGGYLTIDSFHTTHGRTLPFATGLKLAKPSLKVVVFSGDGDLFSIGGNHFIHAARRNMDLTVICINNHNYGMTGGQAGPTTPLTANLTTAPYGSYEQPFNLPYIAECCGAVYVARWTTFHVTQLTKAINEAMAKKGFSFVEILAPCPTCFERRNKLGDGVDRMKFYKMKGITKNGANTKDLDINFQSDIIVGKFVDKDRPSYVELMNAQLSKTLGEKYVKTLDDCSCSMECEG